jgi:aspartate/methionine/tyrosine aminotransferase
MTCGAAGGLNVIFKALLDPGDEVIILSPFFVEYHFYIDNHGGVAKVVPTDKEFNLDLKAIESALSEKTKVVLINSPNNPTGQIYSPNPCSSWARCSMRRASGLVPPSIWCPTSRTATSSLIITSCRR